MLQDNVNKSVEHESYVNHQAFYGTANIDLTYRCPLACPLCMRRHLFSENAQIKKIMKEKFAASSEIPLDDFRKLCDFFKGSFALCGQLSDPVYHTKFYEILQICSNEYPYTRFNIHTAAHQKNIDWYKKAFELTGNNVRWVFGLDGLPDVSYLYRKNQKSQLIYDAMMLGREMGINIRWQMIIFDFNEHQIEQVNSICQEKGIEPLFIASDRMSENSPSDKYIAKGNVKQEMRSIRIMKELIK